MYINLKLTHLHLLGILLFIIISANFGFAVYEGVENLVDNSKDRTVGTLSTQKQKCLTILEPVLRGGRVPVLKSLSQNKT